MEQQPSPDNENNSAKFSGEANIPQEWQAEDFELQSALNATHGPIVEIGGPTNRGYKLLEGITLPREPIVTNLNVSELSGSGPEATLAVMDGRHMPLEAGSVGVIMGAAITVVDTKLTQENTSYTLDSSTSAPAEARIRPLIIQEAARVLEPGGLLIWEGGTPEDEQSALINHLEVVKRLERRNRGFFANGEPFDQKVGKYIFRKPRETS